MTLPKSTSTPSLFVSELLVALIRVIAWSSKTAVRAAMQGLLPTLICCARFLALLSYSEIFGDFGDFLWVVAVGFKLKPLEKLFLASVEFLLC